MKRASEIPSRAPIRLREDPTVSQLLRQDLQRAREVPPVPFDVAAAAARFEASVGAPGPAPAPLASGATLKVVVALAAVGAVVGTLLLGGVTPPPSPPAVAPAVAAREGSPPTMVSATHEEGPPAISIHELPNAASSPSSPSPTTIASAAPSVAASAAAPLSASLLREETAHLIELRRAAEVDPTAAVILAEAGHRRFAGGLLHQEREAIAIRCLAATGRSSEAAARASRFIATYPNAPASEGLRRIAEER